VKDSHAFSRVNLAVQRTQRVLPYHARPIFAGERLKWVTLASAFSIISLGQFWIRRGPVGMACPV
jgi:hypothetical protein